MSDDVFTPYGTLALTLSDGETPWTYGASVCDICSAFVLDYGDMQAQHQRWHNVSGTNPWGEQ